MVSVVTSSFMSHLSNSVYTARQVKPGKLSGFAFVYFYNHRNMKLKKSPWKIVNQRPKTKFCFFIHTHTTWQDISCFTHLWKLVVNRVTRIIFNFSRVFFWMLICTFLQQREKICNSLNLAYLNKDLINKCIRLNHDKVSRNQKERSDKKSFLFCFVLLSFFMLK